MSVLKKFLNNESGATAIEYGLLLVGLSLVILVSLDQAGTGLGAVFDTISNAL